MAIFVPCDNCGEPVKRFPYELKERERHFCSRACFARAQQSPNWLECEWCGVVFTRCASNSRPSKHHFCGTKCYHQWQRQPKTAISVNCDICNKALSRAPSLIREGQCHFYCSTKCMGKGQKKHRADENHPRWNGGPATVCCSACNAPLVRPRWDITRSERFFCNSRCKGEWMSINMTGGNHPGWKGGRFPYYGPDWQYQRERARKRDKYMCQHCGIHESDNGRELDIHHIIPIREFGYVPEENENYKKANRLSNLISLCPDCHRQLGS